MSEVSQVVWALNAYGDLLPYLGAAIVLVAIIGVLYKIGVERGWIKE